MLCLYLCIFACASLYLSNSTKTWYKLLCNPCSIAVLAFRVCLYPTNHLLYCRARHKPKIDILLVKSEQFDDIIAAENPPAPDNPDAPSSSAAVHSSVPSSSAAVHSSVPSSSGVVRSSVLSSPAAVHSSEQDEQAQEDKTAPALDAAPASVGDMHTSSESVHTEVPPVLT